MSNPWTADFPITIEIAKDLIESQFPELAPISIQYLSEGWDNYVYIVNDIYAFRFPRRQMGKDLTHAEITAMQTLSDMISTPTPKPLFFGQPTDAFPHPFYGNNFISGTTACRMRLSDDQRTALIPPIAQFLKELHAIDPQVTTLPGDVIHRLSPQKRIPSTTENLQILKDKGQLSSTDNLLKKLDAARDISPPQKVVINHGDLYCRHIVLNPDASLAGIIDWGDIHLNSPARDLGFVLAYCPLHSKSLFESHYGPVSDETWILATMSAISHSSNMLLYALDINDPYLTYEATRALLLLNEI